MKILRNNYVQVGLLLFTLACVNYTATDWVAGFTTGVVACFLSTGLIEWYIRRKVKRGV